MTRILEAEPELQPMGGSVPPSTPLLTAVATDDSEKPPCATCGHKRLDHVGPVCSGRPAGELMSYGHCNCTNYTPEKGPHA